MIEKLLYQRHHHVNRNCLKLYNNNTTNQKPVSCGKKKAYLQEKLIFYAETRTLFGFIKEHALQQSPATFLWIIYSALLFICGHQIDNSFLRFLDLDSFSSAWLNLLQFALYYRSLTLPFLKAFTLETFL